MDSYETITPNINEKTNTSKENELIEYKSYDLKLNEDIYELTMKIIPSEKIYFKASQKNIISPINYIKEYKYEELIEIFFLSKEHYSDITKIFKFFNFLLTKNKMILMNDKNKNILLKFTKLYNKVEINCCLELKEIILKNDEMINLLSNEINKIKSQSLLNVNEKNEIDLIKKENAILKNKINILIEENKIIKKEKEEMQNNLKLSIEEMKKNIQLLIEENKKDLIELKKEEEQKQKMDFEIKNIQNINTIPEFEFIENLTTCNYSQGYLKNFEVFTGLTDNIEYLIYCNKKNENKAISYTLEIMRIIDNQIMNCLIGHNDPVTVIRYFVKNDKEDYLLSCDSAHLSLIWDIQNNYDIKYIINEQNKKNISDAILLFNAFDNNYILISNFSTENSTKLYIFENDAATCVKSIYGTNKNDTFFMIPWKYQNKYYIIELCNKRISISNIFEDELYANLYLKQDAQPLCGYLHNNNLIVSDHKNYYIRIWDLVNKMQIKKIIIGKTLGAQILPWNSFYIIVACKNGFVIVNLKDEKIVMEYSDSNYNFLGLKKINISQYGECLIFSENSSKIKLFTPLFK